MSSQEDENDFTESSSLPQPQDGCPPYRYLRYEEIASTFFSNDTFQEGQMVWVCKSKGRKNNKQQSSEEEEEDDDDDPDHGEYQRLELFLRATVVSCVTSKGSRIQVQYPKGSTYHVQPSHLIPILPTTIKRLVLVVSETKDYRRACVIHTHASDTFWEIGSDFGTNVARVYQSTQSDSNKSTKEDNENGKQSSVVLGIDKSSVSIETSQQRYPHLTFVQWDPLCKNSAIAPLPVQLQESPPPAIIAIDINGNRELPAVLQCLHCVWNVYHWQPRLIIVKSRTLYQRIQQQEQDESYTK